MLLTLDNWEIRVTITFSKDFPKLLSNNVGQNDSKNFRSLLSFGILTKVITFHCGRKKPF